MGDDGRMDQKYHMMIEEPVERLVCRMAVPTIFTMLVTSVYNMADTYFVGSLGTSATAGVGVVFPVMMLIQAVGFFFGQGSGNAISRRLGAQDHAAAEALAATGVLSAIAVAGAIGVLGLMNLNGLARLLGSTETILPYAGDYLRFILVGAPFMATSLTLNCLLRFQGNAVYGMVGMVSGAVVNIALDPLLIRVLDLGVSGAAMATMFSQMLSFILLLIGCTREGNVHLHPRKFALKAWVYKEIVRGGFPSLCRQGLGSVAMLALNTVAGAYGDAVIAALSIVNRVSQFAASALIGFGQGFQPVCGFNYGAGRYDRVKRGYWFCVIVSTAVLTLLAVVGAIFAPRIVAIFRRDDLEVIAVGARAMRLQCIVFPLLGTTMVSNMMLQTMGKAVRASLTAMSRQGLFLIPLLFILPPALGVLGIQLVQPTADLLAFALTVPLTVSVMREMTDSERRTVQSEQ